MAKLTESRVLKDFNINKLLGSGGYGAVLEGQHRLDGRRFAIKLTDNSYSNAVKEVEHFAKLPAHRNVVAYVTSWEDVITKQELSQLKGVLGDCTETLFPRGTQQLQCLCIQMELCGQDLRHWLRKQETVDRVRSIYLFSQLLSGLNHIHHNGLIHRDLKPENIFFSLTDSKRVKIGDFGISTDHRATMVNRHTSGPGTTLYRAPEQETASYGTKADLYTMGLILFEMFHPPAQKALEETLVRLKNVKKLPSDFGNFPTVAVAVTSLLKFEPSERPSINGLIDIIRAGVELQLEKIGLDYPQ